MPTQHPHIHTSISKERRPRIPIAHVCAVSHALSLNHSMTTVTLFRRVPQSSTPEAPQQNRDHGVTGFLASLQRADACNHTSKHCSGTVTTDSMLLHTHVCAVDQTQAPFRVQGFGWGSIGCSPEDWRVPCLRSPRTHVQSRGMAPDRTDMRQCPVTPTQQNCDRGSLASATHMCVVPQLHTNHQKNKSGPVTLASLVLQHTGGRARVQSYTQAPPRSGDHGLLTSQHTCVRSVHSHMHYHFTSQNT